MIISYIFSLFKDNSLISAKSISLKLKPKLIVMSADKLIWIQIAEFPQ